MEPESLIYQLMAFSLQGYDSANSPEDQDLYLQQAIRQKGMSSCTLDGSIFFSLNQCVSSLTPFPFSEITGFMPLHPSFQNSIICFILGSTQDHREICHFYRIYKQLQDSFPLLSGKSKCPRKIEQEQYSLIFVSSYLRIVTQLMCSMHLHLNNDETHQTEVLSSSRVIC